MVCQKASVSLIKPDNIGLPAASVVIGCVQCCIQILEAHQSVVRFNLRNEFLSTRNWRCFFHYGHLQFYLLKNLMHFT